MPLSSLFQAQAKFGPFLLLVVTLLAPAVTVFAQDHAPGQGAAHVARPDTEECPPSNFGSSQAVAAYAFSPVCQCPTHATLGPFANGTDSNADVLAQCLSGQNHFRLQMPNVSEPECGALDSFTNQTATTTRTEEETIDPKLERQRRRQRFEGVFERLRDELVGHLKAENMPPEAVAWYRRNLDYNVPGGKLNRGMSVVDSAEILKGRPLTDDEYFKAAMLGWCVELLQASLLVADDIMDKSITRRGQPCWYRVQDVGMVAINDAFLLEGAIYHLLKRHFRHEPYYVDLLELFHDTTFQTEMGQLVDFITAPEDRVDLSQFSFTTHAFIAQYKTAYYSFYLPVALALRFCGVPEFYEVDGGQTVRPYDLALSVLLPLGEYFQIQDDFLDYAGTPEQIGKIGTDIVDNKCSWCINVALELATPEQRAVLDANYGRKEAEKEVKVKGVYDAIGLRERYRAYEENVKTRIEALIAAVPEPEGNVESVLKREVLTAFLDKVYKRSK